MRFAALFALVLVVSASSVLAAGAKDDAARSVSDMADELSQQIFTRADRNHNGLLSKREFADAESALEETVTQWGRSGLIGKQQRRGAKTGDSQPKLDNSSGKSADKLAKSNKVTQAEFTFYVHSMVSEADEEFRQYYAMADAQRKAYQQQQQMYNAQRNAMRNQYRRPRYVIPYGF